MTTAIRVRNITLGQGLPKICIPLTSATLPALLEEAEQAIAAGADLLEWRADFWGEELPAQLQTAGQALRQIVRDTPLLFTLRTQQEGGQATATPAQCLQLYQQATQTRCFDLLDIEFSAGLDICQFAVLAAQKTGMVAIVSSHNFTQTPSRPTMLAKLTAMKALGDVIPKLAVMPNTPEDVLALLGATGDFTRLQGGVVITMSMGALGGISRMAGEVFGSALTFASGKNASAPGQMQAAPLRNALELLHSPQL